MELTVQRQRGAQAAAQVREHEMTRRPAARRADTGLMLERREEFVAQEESVFSQKSVPLLWCNLIDTGKYP